MKLISMLAIALLIAIQPAAVAANTTGNLAGTVTSPDGTPVPSATVTATSDSGQFRTTTDTSGRFLFAALPPGTYTIAAMLSGFATVTVTGVEVVADQTQTLSLRLGSPPPTPSETPPPPPPPPPPPETPPPAPPPPPPPPQPTAAPGPTLTSLLVGYNKTVPDHRVGAPYYGRYSYILINDAGTRSRALIDALSSASHAVSGRPMVPTGLQDVWRYNLFLMPVWPPTYLLQNASANEFLTHYDFNTAANMRQQYCKMSSRAHWSLCAADNNGSLDEGPIILVFPGPVSAIAFEKPLPKAVALDLTGVPVSQFPHVISQLKQAMRAQTNHDSLIPLNWTDRYIAPTIIAMANVIEALIGKSKVYFG